MIYQHGNYRASAVWLNYENKHPLQTKYYHTYKHSQVWFPLYRARTIEGGGVEEINSEIEVKGILPPTDKDFQDFGKYLCGFFYFIIITFFLMNLPSPT